MKALTKAGDIAQHLCGLIAGITTANGSETDIGMTVYQGRRNFEDRNIKEEGPCAVLLEGEDRPGGQAGRDALLIRQDYIVGGYVLCDPDNPNIAAHAVIRDIKRALFTKQDSRLGGQVALTGCANTIEYKGRDIGARTDGHPIVFAVVHITVEYAETLTDP